MVPEQNYIAFYMNTQSMPYYLVPNGGFITTISKDLGFNFNYLTFALISSKLPPSTFYYNCF